MNNVANTYKTTNGEGFCCEPQAKSRNARSLPTQNVDYEKLQYYYHSDHLGSASYITNLDGEVVQHVEYVPFGEVFIEERNNTWNTPYLFNGKELDEETGLYYYGARYYNPRISLWYGVDPLAEKRPHMSPYNYCSWNPIMKIDPDGMDEWELDKKGNVTNRIENKKNDSFHIVDAKGNRTASTKDFDKGTVISKRSQSSQYDDRNTGQKELTTIDIYKIRGDDNATEIFEFVANNTDVEWSQFMTGEEGDKGLNFLTTGHIEYTDPGSSDLYHGQLWDGYSIREHVHSHPKQYPLGLASVPSGQPMVGNNYNTGSGDLGFKSHLQQYVKDYFLPYNQGASKYRVLPKFKIYTPHNGNYINY